MLSQVNLGGLTGSFFHGEDSPLLVAWVESPVKAGKRQPLGLGNNIE